MKLPIPVQTYFDADFGTSNDAPLEAFAPDAVVKDEAKTHTGHADIRTWWQSAKGRYQHRSEPVEMIQDGDRTIIRAQVTGQFPGSPALLTFAFQLRDGCIERLEIGS